MSGRAPELIIFDSDGVLVDSEPIANRILAAHLSATGYPCTFAQSVERFVGRSLSSIIAMVEEDRGHPLPDGFYDAVQDATFAALREELKPVPGVADALRHIAARKCVASSGRIEKLDLTLGVTGLRGHFGDRLFSATMVRRGKPHPDLFLLAAARMGAAPADCVVVEDSVPGVEAARAAAMAVLGYAGGSHVADGHAARLTGAGATVFTDMADLPDLILSNHPVPA